MSKPAGRPKGVRNSKPKITPGDVKKAEAMFVTGATLTQIKKALGLSSMNVIYRHMEEEKWLEKRQKYFEEREKSYLSQMMEQSRKETDAVLNDLKTIKETALDGIQAVDITKVRLGEATQSYIGATELERRVRSEGVEIGFVSIVAKILKDCIQDQRLLITIADKLKEELDKYRGRPLMRDPIAKTETNVAIVEDNA